MVPDSWSTATLGQIADLGSGTTPSRQRTDYFEGGNICWVKTGDLNDNVVFEYSSLLLQQLVLFPVLRETVKSSADLIVLPEEVVRFQALKPRW